MANGARGGGGKGGIYLRGFDADSLEELRVAQGELHKLADLGFTKGSSDIMKNR